MCKTGESDGCPSGQIGADPRQRDGAQAGPGSEADRFSRTNHSLTINCPGLFAKPPRTFRMVHPLKAGLNRHHQLLVAHFDAVA